MDIGGSIRSSRKFWLDSLIKISAPILNAGQTKQLKALMPVEAKLDREEAAKASSHLEAVGRLLCGIAPWLELDGLTGEEAVIQKRMASQARETIASIVDPKSSDALNFSKGHQPLVDAAFLAQAIIRAPKQLWQLLDDKTQKNLIVALQSTRDIRPYFNNWLLFSAMIESLLGYLDLGWDSMRVDYAIRQHEQWYLGDGHYGDGPEFHADYYNSYVIQPMITDILDALGDKGNVWRNMKRTFAIRASRFAEIQERMISPTGTFPVIGRSLTYRGGAFHLLAQMASQEKLPSTIEPSQIRGALTAVIEQTLCVPDTFDENGWLRIGLHGHQPELGEPYISTGSLYLCSTTFLPLGLHPQNRFWSDPPVPWSQKKIWWFGADMKADKAL